MGTSEKVRAVIVGCGGMARHHIRKMLQQLDTTDIAVICEPSADAYAETVKIFEEVGLEPPPNQPDLDSLLTKYEGALDGPSL